MSSGGKRMYKCKKTLTSVLCFLDWQEVQGDWSIVYIQDRLSGRVMGDH